MTPEEQLKKVIREEFDRIFSSSDDCTLRQWFVDLEKGIGINERIFKFDDPVQSSILNLEKNMLFTACWDKQIRALMLFDFGGNKICSQGQVYLFSWNI